MLKQLHRDIMDCVACPRLRRHCQKIARQRRKAFACETYWGKPIHGFGDANARLMIVGLAPAAHGANRTGRIFTGDRSGDWLFRALHRAGFANQPHSFHDGDGLALRDAYVTCVVRCAPPDNKPSATELRRCISYLEREFALMSDIRVWVALGQIAFNTVWPLLGADARKPRFAHGAQVPLGDGRTLLLSYHPSQQNTFTGRLTEPMFDQIFNSAKKVIAG